MTHIIHYNVWLFNMTITLFIPTIHEILLLTQGILNINHGGKTLYNKLSLPCITYKIFPK
jgi:hypothetical protein